MSDLVNDAKTIVSSIVDTNKVTDKLIAGIRTQYGTAIGDVAATYLPTLFGLGIKELGAITDLLDSGNAEAATDAIQAAMTPDELAVQKEQLAVLTQKMAQDHYASRQFWLNLITAGLKIALTTLIPSVLG